MADRCYQGKYSPKNCHKYAGDFTNIYYRSSWELAVFSWLDQNDSVISWSSEELIVPYVCPTDGKPHRYFPDVKFELKNKSGTTIYLIEIKPKKYTIPPKSGKRKTRRYIEESMQYVKNQAKWKAANEFSMQRNIIFMVWTEDTIRSLGIKII